MSINHGIVWWSELMTNDPARAIEYYTSVCGWSFESLPMDEGSYHVAIAHGRPVAGITDMKSADGVDDVPSQWFTYVAVDDVDDAMKETRRSGGAVLRKPFDVPEVGRIAIARDPAGAVIGLIHPVFPTDELVAADPGITDAEALPDDDDNFPV
ncbi:VOC family protein [Tropicimonas sp.]|uniref:VOC family protein n=1 Tax=Tropicimonas sp. TaxID=2067044 RepID=UPI003A8BE8A6